MKTPPYLMLGVAAALLGAALMSKSQAAPRNLPAGPLEPASGPGTPGTVVIPKGRTYKEILTAQDGRTISNTYTYDFDHSVKVNTPEPSFWETGVMITRKVVLL